MDENKIYKFSEKDFEDFAEKFTSALNLLQLCKADLSKKCSATFQIEIDGISRNVEGLFNYFYDIGKYNRE